MLEAATYTACNDMIISFMHSTQGMETLQIVKLGKLPFHDKLAGPQTVGRR